jgi:hypothetical protein
MNVSDKDIFYIPNAPGGIWKEKGLYLRWIGMSARNLRLKTMNTSGYPGYRLFGGEGKEKTMETLRELGLPDAYYNSTMDRITAADGPDGLILGYIPLQERAAREEAIRKAAAERLEGIDDAYMARMEGIRGVRARKWDMDEYEDRKEHANRTNTSTNRVGYTGARRT